MRLVSQNRQVDIPYDQYLLGMYYDFGAGKYFIKATSCSIPKFTIDMAEYSTKEQAQREVLGPVAFLQQWAVASRFKKLPMPQVYLFSENEKDMEDKEG